MFQIDLSGKTVLITGANSGIGLGIAKQMAKAKNHPFTLIRNAYLSTRSKGLVHYSKL